MSSAEMRALLQQEIRLASTSMNWLPSSMGAALLHCPLVFRACVNCAMPWYRINILHVAPVLVAALQSGCSNTNRRSMVYNQLSPCYYSHNNWSDMEDVDSEAQHDL